MKRMQRVFGDLDTLRFADGRLDEDRKAAFLVHLAEDPAEAERAALWTRQNETIRAAFAGVAHETVPIALRLGHLATPATASPTAPAEAKPVATLRPAPRQPDPRTTAPLPSGEVAYLRDATRAPRSRSETRYRTPLSAALLVAVAVGVIYVAHELLPVPHLPAQAVESRTTPMAAAIVSRAADAYATYALDPVRPVEFTTVQSTQLAHWIKRRLGVAVAIPDLVSEGWGALGGRLVPGTSGPGVFFVYENAGGERLGLFVERAAPAAATTVALGPAGPAAAAMSWVNGPLAYVLTVDKSLDWLSRNGEPLRDRIARAGG